MSLSELNNSSRAYKRRKRVGRGPGSGMGKTSCRGQKGAGARSGYKRRLTYEGGGVRLFQRMPTRGFTRGRFAKRLHAVNIEQLERYFAEGEPVNEQTLRAHGLIGGRVDGIKILGKGKLTKKLGEISVDALSASAKEALNV